MVAASTSHLASHCIVRHGTTRLALPVHGLRQVLQQPRLVSVPGTHPVLRGLCHERGEFLPVLGLGELLPQDQQVEEHRLLIVDGPEGGWGVLVEDVESLARLESTSELRQTPENPWETALIGWASWQDQKVHVLDVQRFQQ
ncbi:MAG: chemotaxis protein CheW, partial [Planctomycetaceae bacterium]|nr:chemotaxis protein CheW [Planctomycetaceae bacterium]